jgi:hypothetical protein
MISKVPTISSVLRMVLSVKRNDIELAELNAMLEATAKAEWELSTGLRRINLRRNPEGKKPQWRWNRSTGKLARKSQGGIAFWRYYIRKSY